MKADKQLVDKLADLAKLEFSPEEEQDVIADLNRMIEFISRLEELDVSGVEPLIYMNPQTDVLREDVPGRELTKEEALKNAPQADSDYFKVPKVLKKNHGT